MDPEQPELVTVNMEDYAQMQQVALETAYGEAIQARITLERRYNEMLNLAIPSGVERDIVVQEREMMRSLLATLAGWDRDICYHWRKD